MFLNFAGIEYSMTTSSLDIFCIGCNGSCEGCFNKEIKDWTKGGLLLEEVTTRVAQLCNEFSNLINKFIIVGGDPVDAFNRYPKDMKQLITFLLQFKIPIYLFTRHPLEDIPEFCKEHCDYIKCGAYIPSLTCNDNIQYNIKLATSNQKIYKKGVDY